MHVHLSRPKEVDVHSMLCTLRCISKDHGRGKFLYSLEVRSNIDLASAGHRNFKLIPDILSSASSCLQTVAQAHTLTRKLILQGRSDGKL